MGSAVTPATRNFIDRLDLACRFPQNHHSYYFSGNFMPLALEHFIGQPTPEDKNHVCRMVIRQLARPLELFRHPDKEKEKLAIQQESDYRRRLAEMIGSGAHLLRPHEASIEFREMTDLLTGNEPLSYHFSLGASRTGILLHECEDWEQLLQFREITCPTLRHIHKKYAGNKIVPAQAGFALTEAFAPLRPIASGRPPSSSSRAGRCSPH